MKKISLFTSLLFIASIGFAQVEVNNTTGNMAIGTVPKLDTKLLLESTTSYGIRSINNTTHQTTGIYSKNTALNTIYGFYTDNTNNGNTGSIHGFYAKNINNDGNHIYGIYLNNTLNALSGGNVYGVYTTNVGKSSNGSVYGVYLTAQSTQTRPVYGVYSSVSGGDANQRYSGYFTGGQVLINSDLIVNQKLFVSGTQITSDERLKSDIKPLTKEIDKLYQLQGKSYKKVAIVIEAPDSLSMALRAENKQAIVEPIQEFGYLAQELKEVFPELVSMDSTSGYYAVNYIGLIPLVVEALKAQQQRIEYLEKTIVGFSTNNTLKSAEISEATQNMYLSDNAAIEGLKLYQNAPNPFNQRTTVKCYVPQNIQKVQLCVYNMQGVQVQCITITERGNVSIEIEAGALSAGVYSYVLLADGVASETKQMILTK